MMGWVIFTTIFCCTSALAQPRIEMDTSCWEIGEVKGGEKIWLVNRFTNVGDSDLCITDFRHSDGGLGGPRFPRYAIKPGAVDSVYTEMLVPTHRTGRFDRVGYISTNDPQQSNAPFRIRGTIVQGGPR